MLIHLDTSFLIDALTGFRRSESRLRAMVASATTVKLSAPVYYEWLRGPRTSAQLADQTELFPVSKVVPADGAVAARAAALYRQIPSPRDREMDILIAACAIEQGAQLLTLNPRDFEDIPGLKLAPLSSQQDA